MTLATLDRDELHRRYFATLRDLDAKDRRKEIQADLGLPESTKDWSEDDYRAAIKALVTPLRDRYRQECVRRKLDPDAAAIILMGGRPEFAKHYVNLLDKLETVPVGGD